MSDYISREAAISEILSDPTDAHYPSWYAEKLKQIPAADVRPVVRGRWANEHLASTSGGTYAVIRCSVCKGQFPLYRTNFCPNCGADMRRKTDSSLRSE